MGCNFCKANKNFVLVSGHFEYIEVSHWGDDCLELWAEGDDNTESYYPKFCPECGCRVNTSLLSEE